MQNENRDLKMANGLNMEKLQTLSKQHGNMHYIDCHCCVIARVKVCLLPRDTCKSEHGILLLLLGRIAVGYYADAVTDGVAIEPSVCAGLDHP